MDDKIINKALDEGVSAREISEKYIGEYFRDAEALNLKKATVHPKVTENIDEIIAFVKALVEKGYAYEADGDVYYRTRRSGRIRQTFRSEYRRIWQAGARISVGEKKEDPLDFAALEGERKIDGEPAWESPWGFGRPGWHIECSAMSNKYLGETIDIHGGGQDLAFPHHENEIAQTEAYTGKKFSNYWMHNAYITIDNEKMSKSKGNFFTVRDILKRYTGEEIRYFLLSGHYRSPINFSEELMAQGSRNALGRMHNAKQNLEHLIRNGSDLMTEAESAELEKLGKYRDKIRVCDGETTSIRQMRSARYSS